MPPSVPLNHYFDPKTNRKNRSPIPLFHAEAYKRNACLEHFDLFKVNSSATDAAAYSHAGKPTQTKHSSNPEGETTHIGTDPTTSFLTAAMTIYAMRAGITAAAGTRLALS